MIKTLIVDDEHLVRKGLMLTLPWASHGFQIVGEADNGESALELMSRQPVDLLLTDLTMPAMDGFELMKRVMERYPAVHTVVLTCHQDFHFVQDALRLGAIDYVVKTDLADDVLEEMLRRIADRLQANGSRRQASVPALQAKQALLCLGAAETAPAADNAVAAGLPVTTLPDESGRLFANLTAAEADELLVAAIAASESGGAIPLWIRVLDWREGAKTPEWLPMLKEKLFYDYQAHDDGAWSVSLVALIAASASNRKSPASETEPLRQSWATLRWVFDDREFDKLMQAFRGLRPRKRMLIELFERTAASFAMIGDVQSRFREWQTAIGTFETLDDWQAWFGRCRAELAAIAGKSACSNDVFIAILRALAFMRADIGEDDSRAAMAAKVNLSQGYFSTLFKEIVGRSFHDAAKEIRLEKAKRLLIEHADMPIYWVAEKTGFQDEKYFSKLFRVETGMVPSEFRERHLR